MLNHPLIDARKLDEIRGLSDDGIDFAKELIDTFRVELPKAFREIETGLTLEDMKRVSRVAHTFKSSCGAIGALAMQNVFILLETQADRGKSDGVRQSLTELERLFEATMTAFDDWYETPPDSKTEA